VTVQARLSEIAARCDDPEIAAVSEEVERLTSSLRDNSMNIRMMPIRSTFEKFRRWCTIWRVIWARMSN